MPPVSLPNSPFSFTYTPPTTARASRIDSSGNHMIARSTTDMQEATNISSTDLCVFDAISDLAIDTADLLLDIRPGSSKEQYAVPSAKDEEVEAASVVNWSECDEPLAGFSAELVSVASQGTSNPFASSKAESEKAKSGLQGPVPHGPAEAHYAYHVKVATSCQKEDFLAYFFNYIKLQSQRPEGYTLTKFQWAFYFVSGLADDELREHLLDVRPASLMDVFRHYHRFAIKRDIDRYLTAPCAEDGQRQRGGDRSIDG